MDEDSDGVGGVDDVSDEALVKISKEHLLSRSPFSSGWPSWALFSTQASPSKKLPARSVVRPRRTEHN